LDTIHQDSALSDSGVLSALDISSSEEMAAASLVKLRQKLPIVVRTGGAGCDRIGDRDAS